MIRGYSVRLDWSDEDAAYVATSPEFPGLSGVDEDPDAALTELREALEMAIEVLEEDGESLPERRPVVPHSGKFVSRLPRSMHAELARRADEEGVSLNSYVLALLARGLGDASARAEAENVLRSLAREMRSDVAEAMNAAVGSRAAANLIPSLDFSLNPFGEELPVGRGD